MLVLHAVPAHKEYRFIFVVTPLWLLLGADLAARAAAWVAARAPGRPAAPHRTMGAAGVLFVAVSCARMLKALPAQELAYRYWAVGVARYGFVHGHDPRFAAYRYLARAPGVDGVWDVEHRYSSTPGYYYLHRAIPLYDGYVGRVFGGNPATLSTSVTHLVAAAPDLTVPGYAPEREFGAVRVLRRQATQPPVRRWRDYVPVILFGHVDETMRRLDAAAPAPPANAGIVFDDREQPAEYRLERAAQALLAQQRFGEARERFREALRVNPDYAPAHAGLGAALFHLNAHEAALAAALRLQPHWALAGTLRRLMGQAARELGRLDEAGEHLEHVMRLDPRDTAAIDHLALVRFEQRRYEDALSLYRRLVEADPDNAQTHANLGATLYYLNRADEAVASYEHALSLDPSLESARAALEQVRPRAPQAE